MEPRTDEDLGHWLLRVLVEAVAEDGELGEQIRGACGPAPEAASAHPPAYTAATLAAAVGLSPKSVRNAIARGELRAVKRGGRWIVPAEAVDAWLRPTQAATVRPLRAALNRVDDRRRGRRIAGA